MQAFFYLNASSLKVMHKIVLPDNSLWTVDCVRMKPFSLKVLEVLAHNGEKQKTFHLSPKARIKVEIE